MQIPYKNTPESELNSRICNLQSMLGQNHLDGALILQKTDLFYFGGTIQDGHLYVPAQGQPVLMVRKSLARAKAESAIKHIVPVASPKQIPDILAAHNLPMPQTLGMELDVVPAGLYFRWQKIFESVKITDISNIIRMIRAVKSNHEISILENVARLADKMMENAREFIELGASEIELAGRIEAGARKMGHQGVIRMRLWGNEMFFGHLMAGPTAAMPSFLSSPNGGPGTSPAVAQGPGMRPVQKNEPIIVDYVFAFSGYLIDITRIFVIGQLPDDLIKGYEAMKDIQAMLQKAGRPGVSAGVLYDMAFDRALELGFKSHFMGADDAQVPFVGHGIGLELDEYPFIAKGQKIELAENMIIALEPKLVFPNKGMVGVENTHIVTKDGLKPLTKFEQDIIYI